MLSIQIPPTLESQEQYMFQTSRTQSLNVHKMGRVCLWMAHGFTSSGLITSGRSCLATQTSRGTSASRSSPSRRCSSACAKSILLRSEESTNLQSQTCSILAWSYEILHSLRRKKLEPGDCTLAEQEDASAPMSFCADWINFLTHLLPLRQPSLLGLQPRHSMIETFGNQNMFDCLKRNRPYLCNFMSHIQKQESVSELANRLLTRLEPECWESSASIGA